MVAALHTPAPAPAVAPGSVPVVAVAPGSAPVVAPGHSALEDALGILTGATIASLGLFLLKSASVVTGGTAGLSLLLSYVAPVPLGALLLAVNAPFLVLAWRKKGPAFTVKTVVAVGLVAVLTSVHGYALDVEQLNPVWAVLVGNVLAGLGIIVIFRHGGSLGGFSIVALLLQERLNWRAGYVQMTFDVTVVVCAFAVVSPDRVLLSAVGAVVMNLLIALNHRPGRYLGH